MAVVVSGSRARTAQAARMQWREKEPTSPEMAVPPRPPPRPRPAKVAVVYYLSRNGHLEHPHFMEVAPSCPDGPYLRDVINRLDALRGKGMARMYSWASKRSYRNGFVWHDLADDDFIHPVAGREYVLKGTERLHPAPPLPPLHASSSSSETATSSSSVSRWEHGQPAHRKKSASAAEFAQYVVYKVEDLAADAATQTEDGGRGHQRRVAAKPQDDLSREETSPPTASTSPETLEALIKANGRVAAAVAGDAGRAKASSVLMQLISCGSVSVKDAVPPRARPPASVAATDIPSYHSAKTVEDKEYFSGSIVDMTKRSPADDACQDQAVLRRSSSCDADRAIKQELAKEAGDLQTGACRGGRPKTSKKECGGYLVIACNERGNTRG